MIVLLQAQDYLFVRAFVPFVASILIKAWKESDDDGDLEIILGGMAALEDEINWFKREATNLGISLSEVVPHQANINYCRFLESLMSPEVEYTVAITAFWATEAVYQESFAHCLGEGSKTPPELKETCARWGNEGFGLYCQSLQRIADRSLQKASEDELKKAEVMFLSVLEHEVEFWNMSRAGLYAPFIFLNSETNKPMEKEIIKLFHHILSFHIRRRFYEFYTQGSFGIRHAISQKMFVNKVP
ncbi:hypothetical protein TanjilG_29025 [Lupinus angustifolius]|uniref:Thiaminase-2/PQQC domain-containing protein n=1 Tax=Lupinus angustifolius TaxID=3871 RepID=A0A4P1RSQ6_LUPAN|nr:hypothetical protein TanjilG_29025 [Lupinus angustifolius]